MSNFLRSPSTEPSQKFSFFAFLGLAALHVYSAVEKVVEKADFADTALQGTTALVLGAAAYSALRGWRREQADLPMPADVAERVATIEQELAMRGLAMPPVRVELLPLEQK